MAWCPKCKHEYCEGLINCSVCGCELVKVLESVKDEEIKGNKSIIENDKEVFLISVSKDIDAKIIESKLNAFGIPSLKKFRGIDNIYGNVSYSGIDIYVPSKLLDNAKDIIDDQTK